MIEKVKYKSSLEQLISVKDDADFFYGKQERTAKIKKAT